MAAGRVTPGICVGGHRLDGGALEETKPSGADPDPDEFGDAGKSLRGQFGEFFGSPGALDAEELGVPVDGIPQTRSWISTW
ncbi:hypothetical protein GCM10010253_45670 [Streptomyces badius]|uniref:Uncharacterized protein n=1 Tax=Streptomyces badius TaxID=1941 RepID=A0ABQ2TDS8_STRBA|nr:hypothetical protein GCM10010253_45670 [Streptomyces badius]